MTKEELISKVENLELKIEQLKQDFYFDMRNKNLEIKSMEEKIEKRARGDEWRIEQFNRNRSNEEQVSTIEELDIKIKELFEESK
jgi:hypothetical protein|tara:strand:- start:587 stop:841 length:255 start_codon:yes stop_codon:yes gene_type:complete